MVHGEICEVLHSRRLLNTKTRALQGSVAYSMESKVAQTETSNFVSRKASSYPIGIFVRARMVSGMEIEAQITKIETTALGRFLRVEYGEEAANITARQVLGFYDFCFLKPRTMKFESRR
jgi:hypothetical protein